MLLLCSSFLYFDQLYIATQSPKMAWTSLSQFVACNKHIFEHSYISSHFSEIPSQWQFHRYPQSHVLPWLHNFFFMDVSIIVGMIAHNAKACAALKKIVSFFGWPSRTNVFTPTCSAKHFTNGFTVIFIFTTYCSHVN